MDTVIRLDLRHNISYPIFTATVEKETERAYLVQAPTGLWTDGSSKDVWIPKSQLFESHREVTDSGVRNDGTEYEVVTITADVAEWLSRKNRWI